ncbi:MAG TPA: hypothetical protein VJR94_08305 [Candidatus Nitrosocosmicus sp.]|nr:hypothetical protein [Candidatus Nitrosocosmicus sp.]
MLFEHEITKNITDSIIKSTEVYTSTGQPAPLIKDIEKIYRSCNSSPIKRKSEIICHGRHDIGRST